MGKGLTREPIILEGSAATFTHRVSAVVLHEGQVLLHRAEADDFWSLPGGRIELLEPATASIQREMREELGVSVQVERLLWVVEGFFEHAGRAHHELGLYFLLRLPAGSPLYGQKEPFWGWEDDLTTVNPPLRLVFQWFPLEALEEITLVPPFLKQALREIPVGVEHVLSHEEGD